MAEAPQAASAPLQSPAVTARRITSAPRGEHEPIPEAFFMSYLSYVNPHPNSPWHTYLSQVDRVVPYLGRLGRWAETLKHPKRALVVDVPIEMDDGSVRHFEGFRVQHNLSRGP